MRSEEHKYKLIFKKWWLHIILMGAQFILGTLLNYSLYELMTTEEENGCGTAVLAAPMAQGVLLLFVIIPLILRMTLGKGFVARDYVLTISLLLLNPLFSFALFLT